MRDPKVYPLTFVPALQHYVWGGRSLETLYGRTLPSGVTAESWEISGHPAAVTYADVGAWAGAPLPAILSALGERLVGSRAAWAMERKRFPLLVKLLDAHQDLSVQVHPGDRYALSHEHGELGKTEMWYFLSVAPDTRIILGLRPGATPAAFSEALQAGSLPDLLNYLPVSAGDAVEVRTGTIHALLAGAVVTEIQQNSDLTYRVYDWGRLGVDGTPRPLHIQQALDVIDFDAPHGEPVVPLLLTGSGRPRRFELARNRYFVVEKVELGAGAGYRGRCDGSTLEIWGCIDGHATIRWDGEPVQLPAIRYSLLPAALGSFSITAATSSVCLRIYLPPAGLDDAPGAKSI